MFSKYLSIAFLFLLNFVAASAGRGLIVPKAVVVSAHPLASQVGVEILQKGGNAIDAAVAVQFALAVVYPSAGNLGGGGFLVFRKMDGKAFTLDFREKSPAAATKNMFLDDDGEPRAELSLFGRLAAGVPGTVEGMVAAHKRFGKLKFTDLLQPAVELARRGFPISARQANELNNERNNFIEYNSGSCAFLSMKAWKAGDTLYQPDLAATLERIRDNGRAGFYEGPTAAMIVNEMQRGGGIITAEDLRNYNVVWRVPAVGTYKQYKIVSMPPPSSGGVALLQLLAMAETKPLAQWRHNSVETVHFLAEAERRVYADRAEYLGDPDFVNVPIKGLLDKKYIAQRLSTISPDSATPSDEIVAGLPPNIRTKAHESEETTHFSIIDADRNAVAVTTTLNGSYGAKTVVAGAGFLLNNEMDDFSAKPGTPNAYGLIGGAANSIAPNKRMLSSMTPTIIEKEGKLFMVLGTPGGSTIITSVLQTILNVTEFGMTMQEAVAAPRFHNQWQPDRIYAEIGTFNRDVRTSLEAKGHEITERTPIGRVDAALVLPDGTLEAGADTRGDDAAGGY
ncbi:gamma-glutamyltransferase [Ignavibacteria bacterium]|nr:gamma-glutamyltransferase [Bacteroidota bacterium]MCZ2131852.1 gamma-glutamyltransferase [Bacteroidota bacterium]